MRKILSIILSVTLMLTILPTSLFNITVRAATATGRCGDTAYWTINTSTGKLDITGTGLIGPYGTEYKYGPRYRNVWSNGSYTYLQNIKNVYIDEGITRIATEMFYAHWNNGTPTYINNLESIHIPTSLEYIASSAFYTSPDIYISDLSSWCIVDCNDSIGTLYLSDEAISGELAIPRNVTKIGTGVFYNQQNITSVSIPSTVTSIGKSAFGSCTNLKTATVSGNCPITSDCGLGNITNLTIRGDVDTVSSSFNNLKKVQQINIENGVEVIDSNAFNGCSKLTQVSLANSVKEIGANAFNGCDTLTDVYFDGTILEWIDITKESGNAALNSATIHCSEIADIADAVPNVSNVTYNSEEQRPTVTINGLTEGVDFTVEYSNNINVGTANLVIKGINNCSGEQKITFEILPANISGATVSGITDKVFTNNEITQNIVVEMFDDVLSEGVDYTIDYANNTNVGEASIKINGIGNYCGVWNNSFNIGCKDISSAVVENIQDKTFDYQYFTQENISVTVDNILLGKDKDYTVSYKSNYYAGTASVIITGTGNYTGTLTKYFRINSRDINDVSISGVLSKEYDTTAQTQIPTLTYKGQKLSSSDYKITYTNNTNCGTATMTVTGKNNFTGSFSVEFEIAQADISDCEISGITNKEYTGETITQNTIKIYLNGNRLVENIHYTIVYENNIQIGTARVLISGIGNCKGSVTKTFSIEKKTKSKAPLPTLIQKTISSIELKNIDGMEYKIGDGEWQSSSLFTGLTEGVTYQVYQRWAETDIYKASPTSDGISVLTEHTYDNACDSKCNICGFVRAVPDHVYTDDCDKDCNICGYVTTPKHYYGFKCSTTCSKCGQTRQAESHTYNNACDNECNICNAIRVVPDHIYTDDCDKDCNICGYTITPKHYYSFKCSTTCNKCGQTRQTESHTYDNSNDTTCNECGYKRTKYTVTYYGNGVSGAPTSQTKIEDISLSLSSMSSNSYVFLGWSTTPYGEIAYRSGASYKLNQDISLYAQWGNHCYYCDDTGYTTKGEYKEVKCTTCNSFSFVQAIYWHCEVCNSTYVHEKNGCMDCGSNRITRYIDCPDCFDGYQDEWVTTNVMCSECSGRGYHKTAQVNAPQPELKSKTTTSVTLVAFEGVDYSLNGEVWQESNVFNNLSPGTKYTFYMRYKANSIHTVGTAGKALSVTTESVLPTSITSSKYTVEGNNISKISTGTTVSSLLSGLNGGSYCKVYNGNSQVSGNTVVGTGMVVKIMDGNTVKASYTIIVTGDTNGDGAITITDMIAIKAHVLKKSTLSGAYATAADTNGDNGISITDFIQVKAKILGKGSITAR